MPNPEYFREIPLDEAIAYFNEYYDRVKDTKEINGYITFLDDFISPQLNSDKIDNLKFCQYKIIAKKGKSRWKLDFKYELSEEDSEFLLTDKQIDELQKFNNYLKEDEVVGYLQFIRIIMIILFIIIVIGLTLFLFNVIVLFMFIIIGIFFALFNAKKTRV